MILDPEETALPIGGDPAAASETPEHVAAPATNQVDPGAGEGKEPEAKPEKTAEQREIERLRRGIDRRTRQLAEARAQAAHQPHQQERNQPADDSEPLSLTRAQLNEMVTAEAQKLAPTFREEAAEAERRQGVVDSLAKTWGKERFDEVASDLDDIFGGLVDRSGRPKPATEAVFESDSPAEVIEWLTDPDNVEEAERISRLTAAQAGRAIAKLEATIKEAKAGSKPKPSKAPAPLEAVRGQGSATAAPDPSNTKAWIQWRNEQERKGL